MHTVRECPTPTDLPADAQPAIFLDRDGVVNDDACFVHRIEDFRFAAGVLTTLPALVRRGYQIIIVTNQSGIGRGYFDEQQYRGLTDWMRQRLMERQAPVTAVYHCPHRPEDACGCRKPEPGMLLDAAGRHAVDLLRSWMIGDRETDIEAARRAGVAHTIRIGRPATVTQADHLCQSIADTLHLIPNLAGPEQRVGATPAHHEPEEH